MLFLWVFFRFIEFFFMMGIMFGEYRMMVVCIWWVYNEVYIVIVSLMWGDIGFVVIKVLVVLDRKKLYC